MVAGVVVEWADLRAAIARHPSGKVTVAKVADARPMPRQTLSTLLNSDEFSGPTPEFAAWFLETVEAIAKADSK